VVAPGMYLSEDIIFQMTKRYMRQDSMHFAVEMVVEATQGPLEDPELYGPMLVPKAQRPYFMKRDKSAPKFHCDVLQKEKFVVIPRNFMHYDCKNMDMDILTFDGPIYKLPGAKDFHVSASSKSTSSEKVNIDYPAMIPTDYPYLHALVPPKECIENSFENKGNVDPNIFFIMDGFYGGLNNCLRYIAYGLQQAALMRATLVLTDSQWDEIPAIMDMEWLLRFYSVISAEALRVIQARAQEGKIRVYRTTAAQMFWIGHSILPTYTLDKITDFDEETQKALLEVCMFVCL
jgi:hypothetical protein